MADFYFWFLISLCVAMIFAWSSRWARQRWASRCAGSPAPAPTAVTKSDIGGVRFVPLIGVQGWTANGRRAASSHGPGQNSGRTLPQMIADAAEPLPDLEDPAFGPLFDRYADRRVVLLGEASHGTSEFLPRPAPRSRDI